MRAWTALCLAALAHPVGAAPSPTEALTIALSGPKVAFAGIQASTVATDQGTAKTQVRVFADGRGGLRREYSSESGKIVLLQTAEGTYTGAGANWVRTPATQNQKASDIASAIVRNYKVTVQDGLRLLGRPCVAIAIEPKTSYNPRRRIWCDLSTGIPLRDDLYDPEGRLRSSSVYTELRLGSQPPSLFAKPAESVAQDGFGPDSFRTVRNEEEMRRITGRPAPKPGHVPPGYVPSAYGTMATGGRWTMPAVRYSDGLASFTIFQRGQGRGGRGWGPRGPNSLQSDRQRSVYFAQRPSGNYLLVGDLAESELRRIGESLP